MRKGRLDSIPFPEFDYQTLLDALGEYRQPRMKIGRLLADHAIIRVKKGLYVSGQGGYTQRPYSRELLANLCYGPSYVSLQYALHYHGLIPERVETVTSVTPNRNRAFSTPIGSFTYKAIPLKAFPVGMGQYDLPDGRHFLMAIPEKALADTIVANGAGVENVNDMQQLLSDFRVDMSIVQRFDRELLAEISVGYRSRRLRLLCDLLDQLEDKRDAV